MILSIIVAASEDHAIGRSGDLPWRLPDDLKFFKKTTLHKPVIMGRKTWDSLFVKPLPERQNIVVSRNEALELPAGAVRQGSLEDAMDYLRPDYGDGEEVMLIGGGTLFAEALPHVDRIYLTRVHTTVPDADVHIAPIDEGAWTCVWEEAHPADDRHAHSFTFQKWERRK
jgi:dihydrofolate reductase